MLDTGWHKRLRNLTTEKLEWLKAIKELVYTLQNVQEKTTTEVNIRRCLCFFLLTLAIQ